MRSSSASSSHSNRLSFNLSHSSNANVSSVNRDLHVSRRPMVRDTVDTSMEWDMEPTRYQPSQPTHGSDTLPSMVLSQQPSSSRDKVRDSSREEPCLHSLSQWDFSNPREA